MSPTFAYVLSWLSFGAYILSGHYNPMKHTYADRGVFLGLAAFFMCNAIYSRVTALRGPAERDAQP